MPPSLRLDFIRRVRCPFHHLQQTQAARRKATAAGRGVDRRRRRGASRGRSPKGDFEASLARPLGLRRHPSHSRIPLQGQEDVEGVAHQRDPTDVRGRARLGLSLEEREVLLEDAQRVNLNSAVQVFSAG
jgi:hypothetical protein